jgi:hypothetical protein
MLEPIQAVASISIAADKAKTCAAALALDPVKIVRAKGLIPGVKSLAGQLGPWSEAGQTRRLTLTDGSTAVETLMALEPDGYSYRISELTGPFRLIVKEANARFSVSARGDVSILTWTYEFMPKGGVAAAALSFLVDSQWNGFMDAALERLKDDIERV